MIKIAVDAMGGDNAPEAVVKASVKFVKDFADVKIFLFGDESKIKKVLTGTTYNENQIEIIHTTEVITNDEKPMVAIKNKEDSSLIRALQMVKKKEADAIISAGSTGALHMGATTIIGRIKGVKRATLATIIPANKNKNYILVDAGANVDSKPEYIVQYAMLGSIYMEKMLNISSPKVGLASVGTEDSKGNEVSKEAFKLLSEEKLNFIGNIEARDIPFGIADVVVCDGFTGNIILKLTEGLGMMFMDELKTAFASKAIYKLGALLSMGGLRELKHSFDPRKAGGAPIIGLKGLAVKAHGNSDEYAFYQGLKQSYTFVKNDITGEIKKYLEKGTEDEGETATRD